MLSASLGNGRVLMDRSSINLAAANVSGAEY
jgi:hypothetical protein